jgi:4-nitrophenyl phosphatase
VRPRVKEVEVRGVVLDIDGCVSIERKPIEGSVQAIQALRSMGYRVLFVTNNSTMTRQDYAEKFSSLLHIDVSEDEILTSGFAAALYLRMNDGQAAVYVLGERGLLAEIEAQGHAVSEDEECVNAVVVGLDRSLGYDKLARACRMILRGSKLVATNRDRLHPSFQGPIPATGATVAYLVASTRTKAILVGKPSSFMMNLVLQKLDLDPQKVLMVGDGLYSDVLGGNRFGMKTALVLSGVTSQCDESFGPRPTFILRTIRELPCLLDRLQSEHAGDGH